MCVKDAHVKRSHSNAETLKFHQHQGIIKLGSKTLMLLAVPRGKKT